LTARIDRLLLDVRDSNKSELEDVAKEVERLRNDMVKILAESQERPILDIE
jgi:hypothetical protein